jgi:undecaprenyl-diphosphatase
MSDSPPPFGARVQRIDEAVDRWVDEHRSPTLDRVFFSLSAGADHSILWHAIGAVRGACQPRFARRTVELAAILGAESFLTNVMVKSAFKRVRPDDRHAGAPLPYGVRRPITSSFPSGHAAAAMTAAAVLSLDDRRRAPLYYGLGALVASSRVYVRLHHASDVAGGLVWGIVLGRAARRLLRPRS